MVELSRTSLAILALICGLWLPLALWLAVGGARKARAAGLARASESRTAALLAAAPAMPLTIFADGSVDCPLRLAHSLGLPGSPGALDGLSAAGTGLSPDALASVGAEVARVRSTGESATRLIRPEGSSRWLELRLSPAPAHHPSGAVVGWFTDVTEAQEQAEQRRGEVSRLSKALDALSALLEAAPFPMWHRGPDLRLALVNSAYVAAVEAGDAMAVVKAGIELVDEAEGRNPLSQAAAVREKGEAVIRSVPATIAGERRMMQVVEVPLGEAGVAGYAIDIDDLDQARGELAQFVRAQRDMLDRLSAGVAQFARDRSLSFSNQPFARLFSLRADALAEHPEFNRVLDAMREGGNLPEVRDYPDWKEDKNRWFTSDAATEEDWLLPGGKHLRVVAQPLPDGGLLLIFEDRTEQIQLASARDTLLRVRTATFDNLFEAIGVFASDGRLHLWNNRFRATWDFEEEMLAAHPRVDALTPHIGKKLKNPNHAGVVRELVRSATVERKQRGGQVSFDDGRHFQFAAVPLPDGNALFTMLDVSDNRRMESALRERNEALEAADRLKTAFVSNMSYELRTPLTSIAGFAEMLEGGYAGALPETAADYVRAILESVGRLSGLIDNVLDLTQSDMGSLLLAEEEVELETLCRDAAAEVTSGAAAKGVELAVELQPGLGSISGDRRRLRQSLNNILKNALTHTPGGGRILLHGSGTREGAEIVVSDSGAGIAPADQARVFDRFYRNVVAGEGREEALGLGLPLAKQFIEAHGGRIELVSEPGQGTTVIIRLPRAA